MTDLPALLARVEAATKANRDLDHDIAEALGGQIRRVSRLGLSGRTPGSMRVFWPHTASSRYHAVGHVIPYYTKTEVGRNKYATLLRSMIEEEGR